jgi:uncharacterized Zn finger protein
MAHFSRTWWGLRFLAALEQFTDPARLGRGRSYATGGKILEYNLANGVISARVRGSINPYFGVYKEPIYRTSIRITPISAADWIQVINRVASRADLITKLLMNEMPEDIDEAFSQLDLHLLPHSQRDFATQCSCPDYANPCKHIAGVCYVVASALDLDPFLLFELHGLSRDQLRAELATTPLGRILSSALAPHDVHREPAAALFSVPVKEPPLEPINHTAFWTGARRLPAVTTTPLQPSVPALLIKKLGDYPPFWHKDTSFISVMEELYERVRTKGRLAGKRTTTVADLRKRMQP